MLDLIILSYIYIERERERERESVCVCVYIIQIYCITTSNDWHKMNLCIYLDSVTKWA